MNTANPSAKSHTVTLIPGDGVGPEAVGAAKRVIEATGVRIDWETADAGAEVFKRGVASGVPDETLDSIARNKVALKGPLETPVGYGEKSANVTLRKLFELYGNTRPCRELPGIETPFSGRNIDLVVVRENVEDLYAGIEHMQTPGVAQTLKLISRKGCEKIVRLAFELAVAEGRKSVHCATKANIMKLSEGMLKRTFEDIAPEYEKSHGISAHHIIIDNCAHQLVRVPERFEVIVTTNMNGDILSDLTSGLVGGLGIAPSANLGNEVTMFEAVHGSAPDIAGKGLVNPTAILLSAVMMLRHLGEFGPAESIDRALWVTLEEGKTLTGDIAGDKPAASTDQFADAIIENLGKPSDTFVAKDYRPIALPKLPPTIRYVEGDSWRDMGMDVFIDSPLTANELGDDLVAIAEDQPLRLKMISNRGTKVYPDTGGMTDCIDHWRCRFVLRDENAALTEEQALGLLRAVGAKHRWCQIERLAVLDGQPTYTKAQGED